jgi:hypothetical protein
LELSRGEVNEMMNKYSSLLYLIITDLSIQYQRKGVIMDFEIFVPHTEQEHINSKALADYLSEMYFC